jgi:hypothetical protein
MTDKWLFGNIYELLPHTQITLAVLLPKTKNNPLVLPPSNAKYWSMNSNQQTFMKPFLCNSLHPESATKTAKTGTFPTFRELTTQWQKKTTMQVIIIQCVVRSYRESV